MKNYIKYAALCVLGLMILGCNNSSGKNMPMMENKSRATIIKLSKAFKAKDVKALEGLVSDPYSGLRFAENWSDQNWQSFAQAFKNARLISSGSKSDVYEIAIQEENQSSPEIKKITIFENNDGKWVMDFQTFMVVPHGND